MERLISVKELAAQLGRSERYVWQMRARGFEMPGGRATLAAAVEFLREFPHPCGAPRDAVEASSEISE